MHSRSKFIGAGIFAALTPAIASAAPHPAVSASPSPGPTYPPLRFDMPAFEAALQTPAPHRHLFTAVNIKGGLVLESVRNTLDAYRDIGIQARDVHPVVTLYHGASIALAFRDDAWTEFFIPAMASTPVGLDFATVYDKQTRGNPCLHRKGDSYDHSIESLAADASLKLFVCYNALIGFSGTIAEHLKRAPLDVYAQLSQRLVAGAMLVPAGVWAIHAIQERRYTLLETSL